MPRSNEFTHGGSVGKNLVLLLRALVNVIAFGLLGFGCAQFSLPVDGFVFGAPEICMVSGGVLTVICLVANLFGPFIHRVK